MGTSTDAILAFGFDLGECEDEGIAAMFRVELEGDEIFDFDEWLATRAGAVYPEGHSGIDSPEYQTYSAARKLAIDRCPVELVTHCSYDYPMYFLALRGSETRAWRGSPKAVSTPQPTQEQIDAMRSFCVDIGLPWQEPAWHIFSLWG